MIKKISPKEVNGEQEAPIEAYIEQETPEEAQVLENYEISINYVHSNIFFVQ